MSDALYTTRLRYTGGRGICKAPGVERVLRSPPQAPGLPERIDGIDYVPEVGVAMILPRFAGWREMLASEIAAADAILRAAQQPEAEPTTATPPDLGEGDTCD
jgi:hypothetical protein